MFKKTKYKKIISLLLIAGMVLSLVACGGDGTAETGGVPGSDTVAAGENPSSGDVTESSSQSSEDGASTEETTETLSEEPATEEDLSDKTPYEIHGAISVDGTNIGDKNGEVFQLCGVSTHGIGWFPQYVNKDAFQSVRDDWGANLVRIAMYTAEGAGYCTGGNRDQLKSLVKDGVDYATELGMYAIVDWHILHDLDPNVYKSDAIAFFDEMSKEYKDYDNIIYEICNEPNGGTTWSQVKSYALEVIPVIRANDPNAIIIVGTPTWSQDVDIAAGDPITDYDNIMYALHFYADTHRDSLRSKMETAINAGLAVFVTEFSICGASGDGYNNIDEANKWIELLDKHNIGFAAWNLANKAESSSLLKSGCSKTAGWTYDELSESGQWLVGVLNDHNPKGAGLLNGQEPVTGDHTQEENKQEDNNNQNSQPETPVAEGSKDDLKVTLTATNSWESNGSHYTQFSLSIKNTGSGSVSGWKLQVELGQTPSVDQIWCGKASCEGTALIITPESYNGTLEGGKTLSDIGFIIKTPGKITSTQVTVW